MTFKLTPWRVPPGQEEYDQGAAAVSQDSLDEATFDRERDRLRVKHRQIISAGHGSEAIDEFR
jgi:hypothetical protein